MTPALFAAFPTPQAMAAASLEELEGYIKTCGFHHSKAKDIIACAQKLVHEFDGQVPRDMDALLTLPGVGRKSANLIMGDIWGQLPLHRVVQLGIHRGKNAVLHIAFLSSRRSNYPILF